MVLFLLRQPETRSFLTLVSAVLLLPLSKYSIIAPSFIWEWVSARFAYTVLYFGGTMFLMRWWAKGGQYPQIETANLDGQTFLITGAGGGIGKETALELAKRGARIVLFARRGNLNQAVEDVKKVARSRSNVVGYQLDLSDLQAIKSCVEEFMKNEDP